jgi:hypothetical protein
MFSRPQHAITVMILSLLLLLATGCAREDPWHADDPIYALNAFLAALAINDYETVWAFLDEATQQRLEEIGRGNSTSPQVVAVTGEALLNQILFRISSLSEIYIESRLQLEQTLSNPDRADILILDIYNARHIVSLNRTHGRWFVEFPIEDHPPERTAP